MHIYHTTHINKCIYIFTYYINMYTFFFFKSCINTTSSFHIDYIKYLKYTLFLNSFPSDVKKKDIYIYIYIFYTVCMYIHMLRGSSARLSTTKYNNSFTIVFDDLCIHLN